MSGAAWTPKPLRRRFLEPFVGFLDVPLPEGLDQEETSPGREHFELGGHTPP